jgi:hypothetical protein
MSRFFDYFPTIAYDIAKGDYTTYQNPTNIFFRIGMIKDTMENILSYYVYNIKDGERPEVLADKVYGTPEAHWVILMANERLDGAYDWPLNYADFNNYIANKYRTSAGGGSLTDSQVISWSQGATANSNSIHHYEKVIDRTETSSGTTTTYRYNVDYNKRANTAPTDIPYDYYTNLSASGDYETYTINGKTVREKTYRNLVTIYDYEFQANEDKRHIKIIKPEYYVQITDELRRLAGMRDAFMRRLV